MTEQTQREKIALFLCGVLEEVDRKASIAQRAYIENSEKASTAVFTAMKQFIIASHDDGSDEQVLSGARAFLRLEGDMVNAAEEIEYAYAKQLLDIKNGGESKMCTFFNTLDDEGKQIVGEIMTKAKCVALSKELVDTLSGILGEGVEIVGHLQPTTTNGKDDVFQDIIDAANRKE